MPTVKTPTPEEELALIEELERMRQSGGGGLPPVELPPTGGGGGEGDEGDEDWESGKRSPRSRLMIIRVGLVSALAGDMVTLGLLILAFFRMHSAWHWAPDQMHQLADWHPLVLPDSLRMATVALFLSIFTVEIARRQIFDEIDVMDEWLGLGTPALKRTLPWLAATLVLGGYFCVAQISVWHQLVRRHFSFGREATPASNMYYILTGFHLLHLLAGLGTLALGLFVLGRFKRVEMRQIAVDASAWLWIWMCAMWLVIYSLLVFSA